MNLFLENENKELLWSILYEQGIFENISSDLFDTVKSLFESELVNVAKTHESEVANISLVTLNKEIIQNLSEKIEYLRSHNLPNQSNFLNKDIKNERLNKIGRAHV